MTIGSGLKIAIDFINKNLAKNAIKSLHPDLEKIIDYTKAVPIAPNEDQEHRKWLEKQKKIREKRKNWEKDRHIEFDSDIDIRNWTDEDMRSVMRRKDYPYNKELQQQVAAYFKKKYPDPVRYL